MSTNIGQQRLGFLDGLRGLAAIWVLAGHSVQLSGWYLPVISWPGLGVDLFIVISGFLMVFHYRLREAAEPWSAPSTWLRFWTRRYFRIAPLYYLALCVALAFGALLYDARMTVDLANGGNVQAPHRFMDVSLTNLAMHFSFAFGLFPEYARRTALPDWSIGLEMQFYAVLPFLMLFLRRVGWVLGAIMLTTASLAVAIWLDAAALFPLPAFLPLRLPLFLSGMLIAASIGLPRRDKIGNCLAAIMLSLVPLQGAEPHIMFVFRAAFVVVLAALVHAADISPRPLGAVAGKVGSALGAPFGRWSGELSYGVYLFHLLFLTPIAAGLTYTDLSAGVRSALLFVATAAITYPVAYLTYRLVEQPGQAFGRFLIGRSKSRSVRKAG